MKTWDSAGLLAKAFLAHLGDVNELDPLIEATPTQLISELRRAYYAGAAFVIAMIDGAKSDELAAEILVAIKAEAHAMADELNAANDRGDGTPAA